MPPPAHCSVAPIGEVYPQSRLRSHGCQSRRTPPLQLARLGICTCRLVVCRRCLERTSPCVATNQTNTRAAPFHFQSFTPGHDGHAMPCDSRERPIPLLITPLIRVSHLAFIVAGHQWRVRDSLCTRRVRLVRSKHNSVTRER
jgi:hypothetical protein